MDILNQVIEMMNKEEVRHFKLFTNRTQVNGQRKDLELFDHIRKSNGDYEEEKIFRKLYGDSSKNPFYRLKNRLLTDLNKSLVLQHLDDDDTSHIFHLLSLYRFFYHRQKYQIAYHFIKKAEKKGIRVESYELLDFIYSELIKLSHEIITINPEAYIQKRKDNQEKLTYLREIEDILAAVIYRLKLTQNFSGKNPIVDLLQKTVEEFSLNDKIRESPKLRFALYHSVSRIFLSNKDFVPLEAYLRITYEDFERDGLFKKENHDTKLQMLTYLINTLYKNKKDDEILAYTDALKDAMEEFNGFLHDKYLFYYYNSRMLYYSNRDLNMAIEVLQEMREQEAINKNSRYDFYTLLNLAVLTFHARKYKPSIKWIVRLGIHDSFKTNAPSLRLKIAVMELMVRHEVDDFETVERRIDQVRKEFSKLLEHQDYQQEKELIDLIESMTKSIDVRHDESLQERLKSFLSRMPKEDPQATGVVKYDDWLSEKIKK